MLKKRKWNHQGIRGMWGKRSYNSQGVGGTCGKCSSSKEGIQGARRKHSSPNPRPSLSEPDVFILPDSKMGQDSINVLNPWILPDSQIRQDSTRQLSRVFSTNNDPIQTPLMRKRGTGNYILLKSLPWKSRYSTALWKLAYEKRTSPWLQLRGMWGKRSMPTRKQDRKETEVSEDTSEARENKDGGSGEEFYPVQHMPGRDYEDIFADIVDLGGSYQGNKRFLTLAFNPKTGDRIKIMPRLR